MCCFRVKFSLYIVGVDRIMSEIIHLAGCAALSQFRLDKLARLLPDYECIATQFWHFSETSTVLDDSAKATLTSLLTYGTPTTTPTQGTMMLVVPRPGTISPWSSKATDIAKHCGLAAISRIERGTAYTFQRHDGTVLTATDLAVIAPHIHDRMTEVILDGLDAAHVLFRHLPPKPLTTVNILAGGHDALAVANTALGLA